MYHLVYSHILLLASLVLSQARTIFISRSGAKTYLPSTSKSDVCKTPTCITAAAGILSSIDQSLDPCDDFYDFACGGWMKWNEIPEDDIEICSRVKTRMVLERQLKELLESKDEVSDPPYVKSMKNFYKTCTDKDTIEKQGSEPLKKMLQRLGGGWPVVEGDQWNESTFDWVNTLILYRKLGYEDFILIKVYPNYPNLNILILEHPSLYEIADTNWTLGLDDPKIAAYYRSMVQAAILLGVEESTAEKEMFEVLRFIITLRNISTTRKYWAESEELTVAELQKKLPEVPWLKIINGLLHNKEVDENQIILLQNPGFFPRFADLITSTEKRVIGNYMLWRAVLESAEYLSDEWKNIKIDEEYELRVKSQTVKKPLWKECLSDIKYRMYIGLASLYIRRFFNDETKNEAVIIMKYIHKEFLKMLKENDWMDEKTKRKAEEKSNAMKSFIGYPKELLNDTFMMEIYENLTITSDSYLQSMLSYKKWNMKNKFPQFNQSYIERPWKDSAEYRRLLYVGAFYSKEENSMAIPAGILHETFFNKNRPKYLNFAAIGHIIGHEITHGFDNKGRHVNKDGEKVNWWDEESDERFRKKVKCIIDQYNNYTTEIGMKVNGELTQNENIADNGGTKEAYLAYQSWIKDNGMEPLLPGLNYTQSQLFWISSALLHCTKYQPEKLKEKLLSDSHSPAKFRIIGTMSNSREFSKDFNCPADAPMNRKHKCEVW